MKKTLLAVILCVLITAGYGQETRKDFPNGFHLGVVGETSFFQPMSGSVIESKTGVGWLAGIEFSYHFAKYFGIYAGIDFGTNSAMNFKLPNNFATSLHIHNLHIPIGFEFHHQIAKSDFFFVGNVGVNLHNFVQPLARIIYSDNDFNMELYDMKKRPLHADFQLGVGLLYRLPYNDLIRFTVKTNLSFKDHYEGYLMYNPANLHLGTVSNSNNYMSLGIAYIHCFRTKAQRAEWKSSKR